MELTLEQFEELVDDAFETLPPYFQERMSNVAVVVAPWPTQYHLEDAGLRRGQSLLGLYSGIPLTARTQSYNMVAPDLITLFQGPIERAAVWQPGDFADNVREQVRHTLIHEIAHHFGISDERLIELGAY